MKKVIEFLKESSHYKHLLGGMLLGLLSDSLYCSLLTCTATGSALEYKDQVYSSIFDKVDLFCTIVGGLVGFGIRSLIILFIK